MNSESAATIILAITGFATAIGAVVTSLLTARSSVHRGELEALQSTVTTLQAENGRLIARIDGLEEDNNAAHMEIKALKAEIETLKSEAKVMADKIRVADEKEAGLLSRIETLLDRIRSLESDRAKDQAKIRQLESQVKQLEAQVQALGAVPITQQKPPEKGRRK